MYGINSIVFSIRMVLHILTYPCPESIGIYDICSSKMILIVGISSLGQTDSESRCKYGCGHS